MIPVTARLDLSTTTGRKLVAEVRMSRGFIGDATLVQISAPDRPEVCNRFRISVLREMRDRFDHLGFEDNDPLSVGHGNITRILDWVDQLNGEGEEGGTFL